MPTYIVGDSYCSFTAGCFRVIEADEASAASALYARIAVDIEVDLDKTEESSFMDWVHERSERGWAERMRYAFVRAEPTFPTKEQQFDHRVRASFPDHPEYGDLYLAYFYDTSCAARPVEPFPGDMLAILYRAYSELEAFTLDEMKVPEGIIE